MPGVLVWEMINVEEISGIECVVGSLFVLGAVGGLSYVEDGVRGIPQSKIGRRPSESVD